MEGAEALRLQERLAEAAKAAAEAADHAARLEQEANEAMQKAAEADAEGYQPVTKGKGKSSHRDQPYDAAAAPSGAPTKNPSIDLEA